MATMASDSVPTCWSTRRAGASSRLGEGARHCEIVVRNPPHTLAPVNSNARNQWHVCGCDGLDRQT